MGGVNSPYGLSCHRVLNSIASCSFYRSYFYLFFFILNFILCLIWFLRAYDRFDFLFVWRVCIKSAPHDPIDPLVPCPCYINIAERKSHFLSARCASWVPLVRNLSPVRERRSFHFPPSPTQFFLNETLLKKKNLSLSNRFCLSFLFFFFLSSLFLLLLSVVPLVGSFYYFAGQPFSRGPTFDIVKNRRYDVISLNIHTHTEKEQDSSSSFGHLVVSFLLEEIEDCSLHRSVWFPLLFLYFFFF